MHYQLLVAHMLNVNQVSWYTNGNSNRRNICKNDPDLFKDLVHVISCYEQQKMINSHDSKYSARNPYVTVAPGNK